jgi:hypothetical protein
MCGIIIIIIIIIITKKQTKSNMSLDLQSGDIIIIIITRMQLRAIADVAPVVTMATEAMSVMTPTHCGHRFYEVLSQNVELYLRNMK